MFLAAALSRFINFNFFISSISFKLGSVSVQNVEGTDSTDVNGEEREYVCCIEERERAMELKLSTNHRVVSVEVVPPTQTPHQVSSYPKQYKPSYQKRTSFPISVPYQSFCHIPTCLPLSQLCIPTSGASRCKSHQV